MDANPRAAMTARPGGDGYVDLPPLRIEQAQEPGSARVAQHGSATAGEHGRHPASLLRNAFAAHHGVDTLVNPVKSSRPGPPRDGAVTYARFEELRARDHAMLLLRDLRQHDVQVGAFLAHRAI